MSSRLIKFTFDDKSMSYIFCVVFLLSFGLTWVVRHYALKKQLIDTPNHRSSHTLPTPRGGGIAFVIIFLLASTFINTPINLTQVALLVSGSILFVTGLLDDFGKLNVRIRFIFHILASAFALYCIGGSPAIELCSHSLSAPLLTNFLALIYLVWLLNLYNFMDGINGIASIEAICACFGMMIIYFFQADFNLITLPLTLGAAVCGFLLWNFPKAKIFMGDSGSGFLGFALGLFSIIAAKSQMQYFWSWLIVLSIFIVDATYTLFYRLLTKAKIHEAHCSHAYQHASRYFNSHTYVTIGVLIINVFWLWPIAICVGLHKINDLLGLFIAYVPVLLLTIAFKAGQANYIVCWAKNPRRCEPQVKQSRDIFY